MLTDSESINKEIEGKKTEEVSTALSRIFQCLTSTHSVNSEFLPLHKIPLSGANQPLALLPDESVPPVLSPSLNGAPHIAFLTVSLHTDTHRHAALFWLDNQTPPQHRRESVLVSLHSSGRSCETSSCFFIVYLSEES